MEFKKSKYYNKEFLGEYLYKNIYDRDEIFSIQEFFNTNDTQKEYFKDGTNIDNRYYSYKLAVCKKYYELDYHGYNEYLYLIFDKPVHITGKYCIGIIAPEIIIRDEENEKIHFCIANSVTINSNYKYNYRISRSKINNLYFHNKNIYLIDSEINNLFIFNQKLYFYDDSKFLTYHKIKSFGKCENLETRLLTNERFKKGIIHIE